MHYLAYLSILFLTFDAINTDDSTPSHSDGKAKRDGSVIEQTNIILIGATGDLARKYLWKGLFDLFIQHKRFGKQFNFVGAARLSRESGFKQMMDVLEEAVKCSDRDLDCQMAKKEFVRLCAYRQLKAEADYQKLGESLKIATEDNRIIEKSRIFYLSVPPYAYSEIVQRINRHCRPSVDVQMKVVLEKPFGSDLKSAKEMAENLSNILKEDEIYRVDHYLGKPGVSQILKFRLENEIVFEPLLNRDHVEKVEIVLKEKSDCRRRTAFYDKYGVIRDVIQNHITELLTLIAMDLPSCSSNLTESHVNKLKLLNEIISPSSRDAVVGQYRDYNKHCLEEKNNHRKDEKETKTSTYAAVVLYINNPRWHGVPFVVISGKKLDERTAYVKVLFKNNIFKINSALRGEQCETKQLIFNIQGGKLNRPAVLVSHNLPQPLLSSSYWQQVDDVPGGLFGCCRDCFRAVYRPLVNSDSYSSLIGAVFNGRKDLFIGTADLLAAWKVWTPLLNSLKFSQPRLYGEDLSVLNFVLNNGGLQFSENDDKILGSCSTNDVTCKSSSQTKLFYKLRQFRGSSLLTGSEADVVEKLGTNIIELAFAAISARGAFHLALSGGSTSLKLFKQLAKHTSSALWKNTHIWMVDERCVPNTDKMSNFYHLHNELLQFVKIPYFNIHPMLVSLSNGLCNPRDQGAKHYEAQLRHLLQGNNKLDYVVLGVGFDGHTASLFPGLAETENNLKLWVKLSSCSGNCPVKNRMTMTFDFLNQAKVISVLILGEKKRNIVKKICGQKKTKEQDLPILKVKPIDGALLWYIDDEALGKISHCEGA